MIQVIFSVATVALTIFALIDLITSDEWKIKHLPKLVWVLLIIFLPLIGSLIWLVVGKDRGTAMDRGTLGDPRREVRAQPGDQRREAHPSDPLMTDEQRIENEIAFHERQAEIRRLESELRRRRANPSPE